MKADEKARRLRPRVPWQHLAGAAQPRPARGTSPARERAQDARAARFHAGLVSDELRAAPRPTARFMLRHLRNLRPPSAPSAARVTHQSQCVYATAQSRHNTISMPLRPSAAVGRARTEKMRRVILVCAVLVALHSLTASAQFDTAVVLGTVHDSTGAVVPGAAITLRNAETGITATAHSDENGNYQFLNVRIGSYEITAELAGFSSALVQGVGVAVNARQRVDLTLQVSALTDASAR